jgi:hypothetical protein
MSAIFEQPWPLLITVGYRLPLGTNPPKHPAGKATRPKTYPIQKSTFL